MNQGIIFICIVAVIFIWTTFSEPIIISVAGAVCILIRTLERRNIL